MFYRSVLSSELLQHNVQAPPCPGQASHPTTIILARCKRWSIVAQLSLCLAAVTRITHKPHLSERQSFGVCWEAGFLMEETHHQKHLCAVSLMDGSKQLRNPPIWSIISCPQLLSLSLSLALPFSSPFFSPSPPSLSHSLIPSLSLHPFSSLGVYQSLSLSLSLSLCLSVCLSVWLSGCLFVFLSRILSLSSSLSISLPLSPSLPLSLSPSLSLSLSLSPLSLSLYGFVHIWWIYWWPPKGTPTCFCC